jgi:5-methylcytosine-specific restriction endonuclease McrA
MINSSFKELVQNLFETTNRVDRALVELKNIGLKIEAKYDPRSEFIRWRNSKEGQQWKRQQYKNQNKCCAICSRSILLKGSHIDHIKPVGKFPDLALDTNNMQIACPDCNTSKNNKI